MGSILPELTATTHIRVSDLKIEVGFKIGRLSGKLIYQVVFSLSDYFYVTFTGFVLRLNDYSYS